jgi:dolichol-phosphate mannosyltransferase
LASYRVYGKALQRIDTLEIHHEFQPRKSAEVYRPAVSIVLPVYKLGSSITVFVDNAISELGARLPSFELVIVDDGSKDGTLEATRAIKDPRVRVVGYGDNRGKGEALLYGIRFALGETIIFADGDMQALPVDFQHYLDAVKKYDIAIASKRIPGARVVAGSKRKFLSIGFNGFVRVLLSLPISDTQAGFKIFRGSALKKIIPLISVKRYAFDVELLTVANLLNLKILELPASVILESNFKSKNIGRMFIDVLGIAYRLRIRRWYQANLKVRKNKYEPILNW